MPDDRLNAWNSESPAITLPALLVMVLSALSLHTNIATFLVLQFGIYINRLIDWLIDRLIDWWSRTISNSLFASYYEFRASREAIIGQLLHKTFTNLDILIWKLEASACKVTCRDLIALDIYTYIFHAKDNTAN